MKTQDYGVQGGDVSGDVSQTMPMLGIYYYFMGFYAIYISSESESESSSTTSTSEEDMENEPTTSDRKSDPGNPIFPKFGVHATLHMLNSSLLIQFLILADYITTASELWDTSSTSTFTSVKSSTSQYSHEPLPTYSHLLDYFPASINQPQPRDTIFVPRECMWDMKLRCPLSVDITRDPETEDYIRSFQDHLPPNIENDDVIIISTPPHIIEDSDPDVVCLD